MLSPQDQTVPGDHLQILELFVTASTMNLVYCAYVRSVLEYASGVWSPTITAVSPREAVQDRLGRLVGLRLG